MGWMKTPAEDIFFGSLLLLKIGYNLLNFAGLLGAFAESG